MLVYKISAKRYVSFTPDDIFEEILNTNVYEEYLIEPYVKSLEKQGFQDVIIKEEIEI